MKSYTFKRVFAVALIGFIITATAFSGGKKEPEPAVAPRPDLVPVSEDYPRHLLDVTITAFNEAPMLAEMVQRGELPPVEQRLPDNPVVVGVRHSIGHYGGTLRSTWYDWPLHVFMTNQVAYADLVKMVWGNSGEFEPDLAKRWEVSDDRTQYTFHLRRGLRWSDGELFTTDDIAFWYEHVLQNPELTPVVPTFFQMDGEIPQLTVIDDYTFRLTFPQPYGMFLMNLTQAHPTGFAWTEYPAHYMSQFHPDFTDEATLARKARNAGVDSWVTLFENEHLVHLTGNKPVLWAFKPEGPAPEDGRIRWVRNPYYYKVDSEGNQLPYIDHAVFEMLGDREVVTLNLVAGQYDYYNGIATRAAQYGPLKEGELRGAPITVIDSTNAKMGQVSIYFNLTVDDAVLRAIFNDIRFRRAVSLALDRQEIVDAEFFGAAEGNQAAFAPGDPLYDPEWGRLYADYDLAKANSLLDEMGLTSRDSAGYRLRPDGQRLTIDLDYVAGSHVTGRELIKEHLSDAGIEIRMRPAQQSLWMERASSNSVQLSSWAVSPGLYEPQGLLPGVPSPAWGVLWTRYMNTGGADGEEPPEAVKRLYDLVERATVADTVERRIELLREAGEIHKDNLFLIGVAGMDKRPQVRHHRLFNVRIDPPHQWGVGQNPGAAALYVEQWFIDPDQR